MYIVGREKEQQLLQDCLDSGRPEFIVLYGRRRVGKTYLIKEFFENMFSFYATGVNGVSLKEQLSYFDESLKEYGEEEGKAPTSWREAFLRLKKLLKKDNIQRDPVTGRRIVFLDELPWMDTPRSNFKAALDHFWNGYASSESDIMLIVCGSATSWIIGNLLNDRGGFHNRMTHRIHIKPFTLSECNELYKRNNIVMGKMDILQSYMVFGGIPYYLNMISRRQSLAQNIDSLLFLDNGELHNEFDVLFSSLYRNPEKHMSVISSLAKKRVGLTRTEIIEDTKIADGKLLTKTLRELEECGFIRAYKNYAKNKNDSYYQITDPFTLFWLDFKNNKKITSWTKYLNTPEYNIWFGLAFEMLCLNHTDRIKEALGISGVESMEYSWRSKKKKGGAQIDLLIDRSDNVINICEMKSTGKPFAIDETYEKELQNKISVFAEETNTKKALHLTMITANGLIKNEHSGIVVNEITADTFF